MGVLVGGNIVIGGNILIGEASVDLTQYFITNTTQYQLITEDGLLLIAG